MFKSNNSVHKTFGILEHFTVHKPEWGVTELAREIGVNKSTIFRFMSEMHALGILVQDRQTEKYRLGLKLFELGNRVQLHQAFVAKTHPELLTVAMDISETVHLAILKNHQVFYIDKVESPQGLKISSQIGSTNPSHATALGKILLAFLAPEHQMKVLDNIYSTGLVPVYTKNTISKRKKMTAELNRIRKKKFAIDREEFEVGLICVAIPIFNKVGEVVASLSASGPSSRFKEVNLKHYVSILNRGASAIQQKIGNFRPSTL